MFIWHLLYAWHCFNQFIHMNTFNGHTNPMKQAGAIVLLILQIRKQEQRTTCPRSQGRWSWVWNLNPGSQTLEYALFNHQAVQDTIGEGAKFHIIPCVKTCTRILYSRQKFQKNKKHFTSEGGCRERQGHEKQHFYLPFKCFYTV